MAQHLLDRPQIRPGVQQVCGKGMPEPVRTQMLPQPACYQLRLEQPVDRARRKSPATRIEKEGLRSCPALRKLKANGGNIILSEHPVPFPLLAPRAPFCLFQTPAPFPRKNPPPPGSALPVRSHGYLSNKVIRKVPSFGPFSMKPLHAVPRA